MALTIDPHDKEKDVAKITVDRRLWLDADGNLVEDGDPAATFLWTACAGREVQAAEAERLGYEPKDSTEVADTADDSEATDGNESEASSGELTCDVCGKTAKTAAGLSAHRRSHENEKDGDA